MSVSALLGASVLGAPAFAQFGPAPELPDGAGKDMVETVCTTCHTTFNIIGSAGYTAEQWDALTSAMIDLSELPDEKAEIVAYLAEHFPPNTNRASATVDGPLELTFTSWVAPTLGQRARDPVEAPDGSIWWVGQVGNLVGRLDPGTGEMQEWTPPERTLPHSVTIAADGTPWILGNGNGTLLKLDPESGEFTVYPMPDPAARDPHTGEFDAEGIFWFTLQQSNMIGRFDPETEEIDLVTLPRERSRPYGIKIDADGAPWVACNGNNCLIKVNPDTMELTEIVLPDPGTTTRRLDIAEDGMIWFDNSSLGRIGRYNPETGAIDEWPTPSGPRSHPYGMEVVDGIVWFNESGVRPDMLVRFDPETEIYQSWAIPSGDISVGINRHMRPTRDGDLLIHQDATNRIFRVELPPAD